MKEKALAALIIVSCVPSPHARAVDLIAIGTISGAYEDFATETSDPLENGVPGNRLGGIGSGITYAGGTTFLALPDRGPNASSYNRLVDDTTSYIPRIQTLNLSLAPSKDPVTGLPCTLTPMLLDTTLLSSPVPLVYGTGAGLGLGSGEPALNKVNHTYYFTGRSDNFEPGQPSTDPRDGRIDPEGIRISNNGQSVFVSDEYGPYLYEFNRSTGKRIKSIKLPANLAITKVSAQKDVEIGGNTIGRVANKGMEGLAITPDGKTLVGIVQANLEQDKKGSLRIVTVDLRGGEAHEYAYKLTTGSGVSEILAVNNHQFLVDERDGNGLGDTPLLTDTASAAKIKKLYLIDIAGAVDVTGVTGPAADLTPYAKPTTEWLDIVAKLNAAGINSFLIPSKIEGVTFGPDIVFNGTVKHTLYVASDNDFLATVADPFTKPTVATRGSILNPNQIYVFAFGDEELPGYVPQPLQ